MRDNILLKTEDNIKFVKLVFPLKENNTWNGNVHNTEEPLTYRIKDLGRPYNQFNETLKVVQGSEDSTLVKKVYRLEVFAKNTGLIYKQYDNFIYNQDVDFGKYKLSNGSTRYIERIVEQGKF